MDRLLVEGDGFFGLVACAVNFRQVAARQGVGGIDGQGFADEVDGDVAAAGLLGEESHQVQGRGVVGILAQNLFIQFVGLVQPSGMLVLQGHGQQIVNRPLLFHCRKYKQRCAFRPCSAASFLPGEISSPEKDMVY